MNLSRSLLLVGTRKEQSCVGVCVTIDFSIIWLLVQLHYILLSHSLSLQWEGNKGLWLVVVVLVAQGRECYRPRDLR